MEYVVGLRGGCIATPGPTMVGIFEGGDVLASRDVPPTFIEMTSIFTFTGICSQNFAMALIARTFAHVQFASLVPVLWVDEFGTLGKYIGFQGVAKLITFDATRPSLSTFRLIRVGHVLRQDGTRPQSAHSPRVPKVLAIGEMGVLFPIKIVALVTIEVATKSA